VYHEIHSRVPKGIDKFIFNFFAEELAVFTDKIEALNQLKLKKDGRLKSFKTHSEAAIFAKKGLKKCLMMTELKCMKKVVL
jgi:hypothetical protein